MASKCYNRFITSNLSDARHKYVQQFQLIYRTCFNVHYIDDFNILKIDFMTDLLIR